MTSFEEQAPVGAGLLNNRELNYMILTVNLLFNSLT